MVMSFSRMLDERQRAEWNQFVDLAPCGVPQQLVEFGEWWAGVDDNLQPVGYFRGRDGESLRFVGFCYSHQAASGLVYAFPRGPVADSDRSLLAGLRSVIGRVSPEVPLEIGMRCPYSDDLDRALTAQGWARVPRAFHDETAVVDLRPDIDSILLSFSTMTRRAIRRAERDGFRVRIRADEAAQLWFVENNNRVARARGFELAHPEYVGRALASEHSRRAMLFVLEDGAGRIAAANLVLLTRTLAYWQKGAVSAEQRAPGQLLHWETMRWAKDHGVASYDFGGLSTPEEAGIRDFKLGFTGGRSLRLLPAYRHELGAMLAVDEHEEEVRSDG
jgi:CelD/BcsL family acetyltransferase involved in cellulose biosynthesis